jgi:hypothetical protein
MNRLFCIRKINVLFLAALLFILNSGLKAQEDKPETSKLFLGKWTTGARQDNAIAFGNNLIRASLLIFELDGLIYAKMESSDADMFNTVADDVTIDGNKIKLFFKQIDGLYKGKLDDNKKVISGTLVLTGKYISVSFVKVNMEK